jgi:hypothetical protein
MFISASFVNGIFVICVNAPDCKIVLELILSEIFLAFFIVSGPYFEVQVQLLNSESQCFYWTKNDKKYI